MPDHLATNKFERHQAMVTKNCPMDYGDIFRG